MNTRLKYKKQKLINVIQNSPLVFAMFRLHKHKVNTKFLIRSIDILFKQNQELYRNILHLQETQASPIFYVGKTK